MEQKELQDVANLLRRDVLKMTSAAGSGHPTSCLSCAELISVIFFNELRLSGELNSDEFVLSKGHAAPILYAALSRSGMVKENLQTLRRLNSALEGHPIPGKLPRIKVATGSLGQGLSVGVGLALASKKLSSDSKTYVLIGDSEMAEGSLYEAFQLASYYHLNNLCAIIDVNRLGQSGETMLGHDLETYKKRIESFGWQVEKINGHDTSQISSSLQKLKSSEKPLAILAKTVKGKGVSFLEDREGWHGKVLNKLELEKALKEIPSPKMPQIKLRNPEPLQIKVKKSKLDLTKYRLGQNVSTRESYGAALANLCLSSSDVLALDGEVSNSTFSQKVKVLVPEQFVECFIAEQNLVGMALGLSKKSFNVFASTFAAFLTRAHDQLRMAALSQPSLTFCGSHAGVSIGEDGASQMGLEDLAMFRSLPNSIVFYPSDAVSTGKLVELSAKTPGLKYLRLTRGKTPVIYKEDEKFSVGDFKILKESKSDAIVLIGAGVTLHEAIKASQELKKKKLNAAVIDLYCIKPLNAKKLIQFIKTHGNKIIIAEDHYKEGGIGEMLSSELINSGISIESLAIKEIPHSGTPEQLLEKYQINAKSIENAAINLV